MEEEGWCFDPEEDESQASIFIIFPKYLLHANARWQRERKNLSATWVVELVIKGYFFASCLVSNNEFVVFFFVLIEPIELF